MMMVVLNRDHLYVVVQVSIMLYISEVVSQKQKEIIERIRENDIDLVTIVISNIDVL